MSAPERNEHTRFILGKRNVHIDVQYDAKPRSGSRHYNEPETEPLPARPDWWDDANCLGDNTWFHYPPGKKLRAAQVAAQRAKCSTCPVDIQCARTHTGSNVKDMPSGVFAGIYFPPESSGNHQTRNEAWTELQAVAAMTAFAA